MKEKANDRYWSEHSIQINEFELNLARRDAGGLCCALRELMSIAHILPEWNPTTYTLLHSLPHYTEYILSIYRISDFSNKDQF